VLVSQSESKVHDVLHAVRLAQMKPPVHALGAPAAHVPLPLQALTVSWPLRHEGVPHAPPAVGNTHAPVPLHDVAPHVPLAHAVVQQLPVPLTPQTSLAHAALPVHT